MNPRRCPAQRPIGPSARGRLLEPGEDLCAEHAATDRKRVCGAPAGGGPERPPRKAWPIAGLPFCARHDPQLREECRLARESVLGQLTRVREALADAKAPVLARVLDQLVTSQRVQADDVTMLLQTWGAGRGEGDAATGPAAMKPARKPTPPPCRRQAPRAPSRWAKRAVSRKPTTPPGHRVKLALTLFLTPDRAEYLTARAIREGKNVAALVAEILRPKVGAADD